MKSFKHLFALAACAFALLLPSVSFADERAQFTVLNERFDNVDALANWTTVNHSTPAGQSWFQGNPGVFPAHGGTTPAYIAADYLSARNGKGWIDNWLITPEVELFGASTLSLFVRGDQAPGMRDLLEIRFSPFGASSATEDFYFILGTLGGLQEFPATWQQFITGFDFTGSGRFAFRYTGDAEASNYIGIDSVVVTTVPEADAYAMLLAGLAVAAVLRRRRAATADGRTPS